MVVGDKYKAKYINPTTLPAKHKWKYPNVYMSQPKILILLCTIFLLVILRIHIENRGLNQFVYYWNIVSIPVILSIFAYGINSVFMYNEMEITKNYVTYSIVSILKRKTYKDKLSKFKGIYVVEEQRHKIDLIDGGSTEMYEAIYTVLLCHQKLFDVKFPLYETTIKSIAEKKAEKYSELLNLPVLNDAEYFK